HTSFALRQVLDEGASERDIDQLAPAADAEHREVALERRPDEGDLELVALPVDTVHLLANDAAVERRVHVAAAGEDQSVDARNEIARHLLCRRKYHRRAFSPSHRSHVPGAESIGPA